jgi:cytochrome c oxidase subunit III
MSPAPVVALRPHAREDTSSYVGIVIALGSWAMMFMGLFFVYGAVRASNAVWPPLGSPKLPVTLPAINTGVIVASSIVMQRALAALKQGRVETFTRGVAFTLVLGVAFLWLQVFLWSDVRHMGVFMSSGIYGSIFFGFTYLHAAHIVAGLGVLGFVWWRARKGRYNAHNWFGVRSAAYFWHFVDAVWLVMFVTLFLV